MVSQESTFIQKKNKTKKKRKPTFEWNFSHLMYMNMYMKIYTKPFIHINSSGSGNLLFSILLNKTLANLYFFCSFVVYNLIPLYHPHLLLLLLWLLLLLLERKPKKCQKERGSNTEDELRNDFFDTNWFINEAVKRK